MIGLSRLVNRAFLVFLQATQALVQIEIPLAAKKMTDFGYY